MFTRFDKAIAAFVLALLALLSLVFKTDLSVYGPAITGVLVSLLPVVVYLVPNLKVLADDGAPSVGGVVDALSNAASTIFPKPAAK